MIMSAILFPPGVVDRLGWVLVHSVWQMAVIALAAMLLLRSFRRSSAAVRYGLLLFALAGTKEQADQFGHPTHRVLIGPSGMYTQASQYFPVVKATGPDGTAPAPQKGDWTGTLTTGTTTLVIQSRPAADRDGQS